MSSGNSGEKYKRKLEAKGILVEKATRGGHWIVRHPETRKILGVFGAKGADRRGCRGHKNLRAAIRREVGVDIDA